MEIPKVIHERVESLTDDRHRRNLLLGTYELLSRVKDIDGEVVHFGVHDGTTSAYLQLCLDSLGIEKRIHCFDPFSVEPLSPHTCVAKEVPVDLEAGIAKVLETFQAAGVQEPVIVPGWFRDTLKTGLPEKVSFAYFSVPVGDLIMEALLGIYPRMSDGAVAAFEGYGLGFVACVQRTVDGFLERRPENIEVVYAAVLGCFTRARAV